MKDILEKNKLNPKKSQISEKLFKLIEERNI